MEFLSPDFFTALFAIVLIDLVLAGDNAIVIALAARSLPKDLQKKAIFWGTVGAIGVRTLMTLAVVWLLHFPGLMLAGGLLLIPIALKLLSEDKHDDEHEISKVSGFWGAMRTIIIADALMGLDNVLGVAGAAHGNFVLVVIGLLISIPIVVWGSTIILKLVDRYPVVIYIGAGALLWTAGKMIMHEKFVANWTGGNLAIELAVYAVIIFGGLGFGFVREKQRKEKRLARKAALPTDPV
ncbi:YjbE family integral membrane protein [Tahibacter aquaticus]|uniref:YjbE family integral membrane protein n=1 Tax=Tahibacter aquaticus TaxID=520092 RepID=A0A4R6Z9R1_9GAMM|nr:TerC family protein [Tahibacter aquaticus]TDR48464.1 YjbE family integral membrane protein [Tahibacter aquaticus]